MTRNTSEPFSSFGLDLLDLMDPSEVRLKVPLRYGIIQIEGSEQHSSAHLVVTHKNLGKVSVKFADEANLQLQAEFVKYVPVDGTMQPSRRSIFKNPIDELEIQRTEEESSTIHWVATADDLMVPDPTRMRDFVDYIGLYAAHKQTANDLRTKHDL